MNHLVNIALVLTIIVVFFALPRASKTVVLVKGTSNER
jgi:hypothetical protein